MHLRRWGPQQTDVGCPDCGDGQLMVRRSCLQSYCLCPACGTRFDLGDLAPRLTAEQFDTLAEAVGDHLSDRV